MKRAADEVGCLGTGCLLVLFIPLALFVECYEIVRGWLLGEPSDDDEGGVV